MLSSLFKDYTLLSLLETIRNKLIWVILAGLIVAGGTYFYFYASTTPTYTSWETLYVTKVGIAADDDKGNEKSGTNNSEFGSSSDLAVTYKTVLQEQAVAEMVSDKLERYTTSASQIKNCVTITVIEETQLLKISATTSDTKLSYDICTAYAECAPEVLDNILNGGSVQVVTKPVEAGAPDEIPYLKYTLIGGAAGVALALLVIIIIFSLDNTMKSSDEITEKYGIKVWAEVPSFGKKVKKQERNKDLEDSRAKILNNETPFLVIESYKVARTNMAHALRAQSGDDSKGHAVIISSFEPSAGKSLTSANVAITMAKRDRKVLLVDADMRKPMQHKLFAIENHRGLSSILSGRHNPAECIFRLQGNLHIMPSGPIPANPSELIDSSIMADLIEAVREVYDYVIIDTPPIGIVTDASALGAKTDGVVLVARQKSTSSSELARAVETLKKVDVPILGAIFTDVSGYSRSYGKYRYKDGYRYRYKYSYDSYEYKEHPSDEKNPNKEDGKENGKK